MQLSRHCELQLSLEVFFYEDKYQTINV
jgi:hypothetical protein